MDKTRDGLEKYLPGDKKLSTRIKKGTRALKRGLLSGEFKEIGVYGIAILVGVLIEVIGVRYLEPYMIMSNVPANIGFSISIFVFVFGPAIGAGSIIYVFTRDFLRSLTIASIAVPISVLLFFRIRI